MKYAYSVYEMKVEEHKFWTAESKVLKGCVGQGESDTEAIEELRLNEIEWLETAKEFGIAIPESNYVVEEEYSGKFSTRVSKRVHKEAAEMAKSQGISLNQYVNDAIVFYYSKDIALKQCVNQVLGPTKDIMQKINENLDFELYTKTLDFTIKPINNFNSLIKNIKVGGNY